MYDTDVNSLWYAVQVKSKKEDAVATLLNQKGYEHFLPTYSVERRAESKLKFETKLLFPGYVFCRFGYGTGNGTRNGGSVVTTPGVIRILGGTKPIPIPTEEIEAIQLALNPRLKPEPCPYQTGQRVRIEAGPLRGVSGVVTSTNGKHRLVLSVELFHRSMAVAVETGWISSTAAITDVLDDGKPRSSQSRNEA